MAGEAHDSEKSLDMESQIKAAIVSRTSYFHDLADTLTFEGVRRLLEKDLGLEIRALDAHKRFVKQWLQTCIESASPEKLPNTLSNNGENVVSSTEEEPASVPQAEKDLEEKNSGGEVIQDSPVMGLMTGSKKVKADIDEPVDTKSKVVPSEARIKKAICARASYLKENSESITMVSLRRRLEEDLGLDKHILDPFKKFVSQQVDEVLNSPASPQTIGSDKKKTSKKDSRGKASSEHSKEETPTTSGEGSDEFQEEEAKKKKKPAPKSKAQNSESGRKRKGAEVDIKGAKLKQIKVSKFMSEESGEEDGEGVSEDEKSEYSAQKRAKKKEVPTPSYGKEVERLKSLIKACGMSVPPVIYKKVKQAPENKRESFLIKELEEILSKEGLSPNPSEKDIKDLKKRKDRAKELEGIDLSNIVSSSRRRSATSFAPPPKPIIPDLSESESDKSENDDEESENDDEDDGEEGGDDKVEDTDEDQENGGDGSSSQASDEGNSDSNE